MNAYKTYFDKQTIPSNTHKKLLALQKGPLAPAQRRRLANVRWAALAACAALILGLGTYTLSNRRSVDPLPSAADIPTQGIGQFAADHTPLPGETDTVEPPEPGFLVESPVEESVTAFFAMPAIYYQDVTRSPDLAASIAMPDGAFSVDLTMEDLQSIFWGPDGIPKSYNTEIGRQDLPWTLFWDGYRIWGYIWYGGDGALFNINIYGEKGRSFFELSLAPGCLPPVCLRESDLETSDAFGTPVTGWRKVYDRDGDDITDYICGSEFMTENDVGVRFVSQNCGTFADPEDPSLEEQDYINAEAWFNTLLVRQALPDGLHLDSLLTAG